MLVISADAMTAKVDEEREATKKIYTVLKSEKKDHCMKPGLAVDMSYSSEHVDVGSLSEVKMILTTGMTEGVLEVKIKALDANALDFEEKDFEFKLSKETANVFPIDLELSSVEDGLYYLTVFTSVEGKGGRVFEIPVKFGVIPEKVESKNVIKTKSGVAITVSAAEEEIK
ncbi:MAG TPA: hypothetical protein ENK94_01700 [Campylobacterales bacterium]|nr:hypothetical protein [Campylobacterales bacterium]